MPFLGRDCFDSPRIFCRLRPYLSYLVYQIFIILCVRFTLWPGQTSSLLSTTLLSSSSPRVAFMKYFIRVYQTENYTEPSHYHNPEARLRIEINSEATPYTHTTHSPLHSAEADYDDLIYAADQPTAVEPKLTGIPPSPF